MSKTTAQTATEAHNLVVSCLRGDLSIVRIAALQESQRFPKSEVICDAILRILESEEEKVCLVEAFKALVVHGSLDARTQTLLSSAMINHRHDGFVAVEAIRAFIGMQGDAAHAISALSMLLTGLSGNRWDRGAKNAALNELSKMGTAANLAAPMLANFILSEQEMEENRSLAVHVLEDIEASPAQVAVQLSKALSSNELRLVSTILLALPRIGVTKEAVPHLVEALMWADPQTNQVRNRYPSLFMIGTSDSHETIVNLLATLGPDAKSAVPALEDLLRRSTEEPSNYRPPKAPPKPLPQTRRGRPRRIVDAPKTPTRFTSKAAQAAAEVALAVIRV